MQVTKEKLTKQLNFLIQVRKQIEEHKGVVNITELARDRKIGASYLKAHKELNFYKNTASKRNPLYVWNIKTVEPIHAKRTIEVALRIEKERRSKRKDKKVEQKDNYQEIQDYKDKIKEIEDKDLIIQDLYNQVEELKTNSFELLTLNKTLRANASESDKKNEMIADLRKELKKERNKPKSSVEHRGLIRWIAYWIY